MSRNSRRGLFSKDTRRSVPSEGLLRDLRKCRSPGEVSRRCGISHQAACKLLDGCDLPASMLLEVERNFYGREDGALRIRMRHLMGGGTRLRSTVLKRLQCLAKMVQDYYSIMHLSNSMHYYYLFPPRKALRIMSVAMEEAYRQLVALHRECPEYDYLVFSHAPKLLSSICQDSSGECPEGD